MIGENGVPVTPDWVPPKPPEPPKPRVTEDESHLIRGEN